MGRKSRASKAKALQNRQAKQLTRFTRDTARVLTTSTSRFEFSEALTEEHQETLAFCYNLILHFEDYGTYHKALLAGNYEGEYLYVEVDFDEYFVVPYGDGNLSLLVGKALDTYMLAAYVEQQYIDVIRTHQPSTFILQLMPNVDLDLSIPGEPRSNNLTCVPYRVCDIFGCFSPDSQ